MVHDVAAKHPEHSIVIIENGHVTGRKVGDGASHVAMEQVRNADAQPMDHLSYLTKTPDGKILKSSTMYIRGKGGKVVAILGINYDISSLLMVESAVRELTAAGDSTQTEPEKIINVNDVLDELIAQSVALVGKPAALLLLAKNATVTICHSRTKNLKEVCAAADILVAAVGREGFVTGDMVKPGAVVIDVGINRGADGKLHGDVNFEEASAVAGYITPVPGGVGTVTTSVLVGHVVDAASAQ